MWERKEATEDDEKELDEIDIAFTKILLKVKRDLKPRPRNDRIGNFSADLNIALWKENYWRKQVTVLLVPTMTADDMLVANSCSELDEDEIEKEPRQALCQVHRGLRRVNGTSTRKGGNKWNIQWSNLQNKAMATWTPTSNRFYTGNR